MEVEFSTVDIDDKSVKNNFCYQRNNYQFNESTEADLESKQTGIDCEAQDGSDSDGTNYTAGKKKKRRRGKHKGGLNHRKWKPYNKLTWPERKELEDRETEQANIKRQKAFASGHPVAPYNTTQFLIDDHINCEASPDLNTHVEDASNVKRPGGKDGFFGSVGADSSDERSYESPHDDDADMFLAKEFSETYDNINAERLQTMTKEQLIVEYLTMERKVESLERKIAENNASKTHSDSSCSSSASGDDGLNDIRGVERISEEIKQLRDENNELKQQMNCLQARK
ncbi:protein HEXIM1-like [Gigantopelta aegis]|uniref:protein HEXIM1-like n=1 Tax=Gigantopelta aegis TaxID=1735272 RepID=UPI001B88D238|nr:protein HEXIM1-like [Gigantopelta aegis]